MVLCYENLSEKKYWVGKAVKSCPSLIKTEMMPLSVLGIYGSRQAGDQDES